MSDKQIPFIRPSSLITGSAKEFLADPLAFIQNSFDRHGDSFRFKAGSKSIYVFSNPDDVKKIFGQPDTVLVKERGPRIVLGQSLLTSEGDIWSRQRQYTQRYFSKTNIEAMIPSMAQITGNYLREQPRDLELHDFCTGLIYRLVIKLIFGIDRVEQLPNLSPLIAEMIRFVRSRTTKLIKLPLWLPTKSNRAFTGARETYFNHVKRIVDLAEQTGQPNLISTLKQDPEADDSEILNQALTFFVASFETTANALFWTLYLLSQNPSTLEAVRAECRGFPESARSFGDFLNLRLTNAVINESLRLYPPAWFRSRWCIQDFKINDYEIPKKATVWASIFLTQRHPEFWQKPAAFFPERFLQDAYPKAAFIPFGGGKNLCVGKQMAMLEIFLSLVEIFRDRTLFIKAPSVVLPKAGITLNPDRPCPIHFEAGA